VESLDDDSSLAQGKLLEYRSRTTRIRMTGNILLAVLHTTTLP
jgi:hypothetical protein